MSTQNPAEKKMSIDSLVLAVDELYIQLRSLKKTLEDKEVMTDDDFREAYKKEVEVSAGRNPHERLSDELAKKRKRYSSR